MATEKFIVNGKIVGMSGLSSPEFAKEIEAKNENDAKDKILEGTILAGFEGEIIKSNDLVVNENGVTYKHN